MNNLQKANELNEKLEKDYMDAQMYADMDDSTFWRTSTISPKEAQERAYKIYDDIQEQAKTLLKEVEKGCELDYSREGSQPIFVCCEGSLCPTCQKAKKICEGIIK